MKIAHYWTAGNWALLLLGLAVELALFIVSAKRLRHFLMLPIFAGFGFAADVAGLVIGLTVKADAASGNLYTSRLYYGFYWAEQITGGVLLLLLALQVVTLILPPWTRVITLLGILVFAGSAIAYLRILPSWEPSRILRAVSVSSAIVIATLAITWVVRSREWRKGLRWIVAGLITSAALQGICTALAEHFRTMQGFAAYGIPGSALLGMILYMMGAREHERQDISRA